MKTPKVIWSPGLFGWQYELSRVATPRNMPVEYRHRNNKIVITVRVPNSDVSYFWVSVGFSLSDSDDSDWIIFHSYDTEIHGCFRSLEYEINGKINAGTRIKEALGTKP